MIKYESLVQVQSDCDVFGSMPHVKWTPPQLFHCWQAHGNRPGLLIGEIVENFSIINGKFCANAHYVAALAARTGQLTKVESVTTQTETEGMVVTCTVARGEGREMTISHSEAWAKDAGYIRGGRSPWSTHLEDMLRKTGLMKLYRALFPDAVAGLYDPAEMSHSTPTPRRDPTPAPRPVQAPRPRTNPEADFAAQPGSTPAPAAQPKPIQMLDHIGFVSSGHMLPKEEYEAHLAKYPSTEEYAKMGFTFASAMALSRDAKGAELPILSVEDGDWVLGAHAPHPSLAEMGREVASYDSYYFVCRALWACHGLNLDYAADAISAWARSGSWADAGSLLIKLAAANTENQQDRRSTANR